MYTALMVSRKSLGSMRGNNVCTADLIIAQRSLSPLYIKKHFLHKHAAHFNFTMYSFLPPPRTSNPPRCYRITHSRLSVSCHPKSSIPTAPFISLVMVCSQALVPVFQILIVPSSEDDQSIPLLAVDTRQVIALACPSSWASWAKGA